MNEKIIGIDLGTSNSAAAVYINGTVKMIPSAEGNTLYGKAFPSYVAFTKDGQLLVGEPARRQALTNPEGTLYAFKRKMGSDYKYKVFGKEYTPQQLSAFLLQKIKRDAESFLGEKIKKAVITVPAYFNDNQRQATKDAGEIAGLEVVRIINEPTAASLAYGLDKENEELKIMVFDFGGGTLDVTIMEYGGGVFEVLSTAGDTKLGGTDMDNAVIDWLAEEFKKQNGIDLKRDKNAFIRLKEAAEKAKIELSTVLQTDINLPYITVVNNEAKHLNITLTRAKLEELVRPIVEKSRYSIDAALKNANLSKSNIDKIIFVGGPTRMPIVQKFVEDYMGKHIERGIDPMECVATGAAIQGGVLAGEVKDIVLLDVTPLTLGVEVLGGLVESIIPANTTIPVRKSKVFTTAADNQTAVTIHVVQGERQFAKDNVSLGMFNLTGIPPAPRGIPQIEVTFDIDANGILHVSAKDTGTGKETSITISASTKLSKEDIEKMKKEAEKFAEEDRKKREEIENRNKLEQLIYATKKSIDEYGDKIPGDVKSEVEDELKNAESILKDGNADKIKEELEALSKKVEKIGTAMYQAAQQAQNSQNTQAQDQNPQSNDNVHDANYEEK